MQGNESVLVSQIWEKISSLKSEKKASKQISEEAAVKSEVIFIQQQKMQHKKNTTHMYKEKFNYLHQNLQWCIDEQSNKLLRFGLYPLRMVIL